MREERLAFEQRHRLGDRAAGVEDRVAFVADADFDVLARLQMRHELVGQIVHVDDDEIHAVLDKAVDRIVDQRLALQLDQRLRTRRGQRRHARAEPRGQDHCLPRTRHDDSASYGARLLWERGGHTTTLSFASAGCCRSRSI